MLRFVKIFFIVALFFVAVLKTLTAKAQNGHGIYDTIRVGACIEANGDTIPCAWLDPVLVNAKLYGKWKQQYAEWTRLRNAVYVTYPYARTAGYVINDVNAHVQGLSKEERKPFLKMARGAAKKDTVRVNRMAGAKEAAEKAGKTWSALSKEERQSFKKEARSAGKAGTPGGNAAKQES